MTMRRGMGSGRNETTAGAERAAIHVLGAQRSAAHEIEDDTTRDDRIGRQLAALDFHQGPCLAAESNDPVSLLRGNPAAIRDDVGEGALPVANQHGMLLQV